MASGKKDGKHKSREGNDRVEQSLDQRHLGDSNHLPPDVSSRPLIVFGANNSPPTIDSTDDQIQVFRAQYGLWEHRFLALTQYSLLRAFIQNAGILAIDPALLADEDAFSPWTMSNPYPTLSPHDLSPTAMQLSTPHHPYLDIVAPSSFRDNVLLAGLEEAVEDQLCYELHFESFTVWGSQPWNAMGMLLKLLSSRIDFADL